MKIRTAATLFFCFCATTQTHGEHSFFIKKQTCVVTFHQLDPEEMHFVIGKNSFLIQSLGFFLSCAVKGATEGLTKIICDKFFYKSNCNFENTDCDTRNNKTVTETANTSSSIEYRLNKKPTIDELISFDRLFNPQHDPHYRSVLWGYLLETAQFSFPTTNKLP